MNSWARDHMNSWGGQRVKSRENDDGLNAILYSICLALCPSLCNVAHTLLFLGLIFVVLHIANSFLKTHAYTQFQQQLSSVLLNCNILRLKCFCGVDHAVTAMYDAIFYAFDTMLYIYFYILEKFIKLCNVFLFKAVGKKSDFSQI